MAKICIIDDEAQSLNAIMRSLKARGHEVYIYSDPHEALINTLKIKPDLVITDIIMPKVSGLQVIFKLKHEIPDTHIIAMSVGGYSQEAINNTIEAALEAGAAAFLLKPFQGPQLADLVDRILDPSDRDSDSPEAA